MSWIMVAYWISSCHSLCLPCTGIKYAPFFHVTLQFFPLRGGLCSSLPLIKSLSMWPIWPIDCEKKWQCDSSQISPHEASWVSTCPVVLISFSAEEHDALINCWSTEGEDSGADLNSGPGTRSSEPEIQPNQAKESTAHDWRLNTYCI